MRQGKCVSLCVGKGEDLFPSGGGCVGQWAAGGGFYVASKSTGLQVILKIIVFRSTYVHLSQILLVNRFLLGDKFIEDYWHSYTEIINRHFIHSIGYQCPFFDVRFL